MTNNFELISKSPANSSIPVEKYVSKRTGLKLYVCNINGPIVDSYISLATEAEDDDGLPHTLEHMVFLGSEDYPYPGILDILANKVYAAGTNAWTCVDNTTYTLSTVEKLGFLQLLPIYLDHILYPLLNESGFITEVYHINAEGEDGGVVYSEMQSCENEDETIVERAMHKLMYPNPECGYRYETGGALSNLRNSTTHDKVRKFHKSFYKPGNMAIIVAGEIESEEIIEVIEKFEEKILTKNPESWTMKERPFSKPISALPNSITHSVEFPSEQSISGITSIGWRGPIVINLEELISLDLMFSYLTDSSVSTLQSHFIQKNSLCNRINYTIEEYKETFMMLSFLNTQLKSLDEIKQQFDDIINNMVEGKIDFDINRMRSITQMKILEIVDKIEDSPHDTISRLCIGDFLYGDDSEEQFHKRFTQVDIFEKLKKEEPKFWLSVLEKWLYKKNSVTVTARPSEDLMRRIGEEDKKRVSDRKSSLGKKGLKSLGIRLENAIEENDNQDVPDEVYEKLNVPSLDNLKLKEIRQYDTYNKDKGNVIGHLINLDNIEHLQLQIDDLKNTNFVQLSLMIDTNNIDEALRKYLQLYIKLIFELPVHNAEVSLTREEVVSEINKNLLEFDASIGIDGDEFDFGIYPQYIWIYMKVSLKQFEAGLKWLKYLTFDTVFDKREVKVAVEKLLKDITHGKESPLDLLQCIANDVAFKKDSNFCLNGLLTQEKFLKEDVFPKLEETKNDEVLRNLNELKNKLLKDTQMRFYICSDLDKLNETFQNGEKIDSLICKYFSKSIFKSSKPFEVKETWKLKCDESGALKSDYIIGLGSTESSFLRLSSSIPINSYNHSDYPGLLVLKEYFCQTEGPLWEAVRGPGYCYYQSLNIIPETARLELCLDECSHVVKAYDATRKVFISHLSNDTFDEQLLETAKNSLIFMLIDNLKSVSSLSQYSMACIFKNTDVDFVKKLSAKIQNIEIEDLKPLLESYIMPIFNDTNSSCIIITNPSKLENTVEEFNHKFDRKLSHVEKLDSNLISQF